MPESIKIKKTGAVAELTLSRPPINALDESALQELLQTIELLDKDDSIKAVVILSGISGVFCAGGDLKFWPRQYPDHAALVSEAGRNVFNRIETMAKPTLAVIQGRVIGDGLSLALACDLRLASPDSSFQLPELDYGFIPGWGTIGRLTEVVGRPAATELLLLGEPISGRKAKEIGLIHQLQASPDLLDKARQLALRIASKPPLAMRYAKSALRGGPAADSVARVNWEVGCFAAVWGGREWRDGIDKLFNSQEKARQEGRNG